MKEILYFEKHIRIEKEFYALLKSFKEISSKVNKKTIAQF